MADDAIRTAELRLTVAREAGIEGHAHRLVGDTQAELEADATQLAQQLKGERNKTNTDLEELLLGGAGSDG